MVHDEFERLGLLEENIKLGGEGKVPRRQAYVNMFKGEFDNFHKSRRTFTNQTYYGNAGLYFLNRALQKLKPEVALSEAEARWFVYDIFGTVKDLVTGRKVDLSEPVVLGPDSTMVLYVGEE